uniref:Uncharacterized protein n=2 Tax=Knipowitschia caucasica TaxID=637954 RepID=A0AAV2LQK1_KNICA
MPSFGLLFYCLTFLTYFSVDSRSAVGHLRNIDSLIRAVEQVEDSNPGLSPLALIRALRRIAGHDDAMTVHFLGTSHLFDTAGLETAILNTSSFSFFDKALHHIVTDNGEEREGQGLDDFTEKISPKRRQLSRLILEPRDLQNEVMEILALVWKLERTEWIAFDTGISHSVKEGLKEFVHKYWECPQIIPRCQWGAKPHNGTPLPLSLPLDHLFVHHTYTPSAPCLTFSDCARDMRAMQRFHQDERGWRDIGYSFVVGSDGYVYEGAGWNTVGTHTRGQNSIGYGVSFIGNYTALLPSRHSMDLLRHQLVQCAVGGGRLVSNFTLKGHRQMVNYTTCPGDALFSEITKWDNFRQ